MYCRKYRIRKKHVSLIHQMEVLEDICFKTELSSLVLKPFSLGYTFSKLIFVIIQENLP